MGLFDQTVRVTGRYSFSFTTFVWDHGWDGDDYAYIHDVDEEEGKKVQSLLEKELDESGKTLEELFRLKYGEKLFDEKCGEEVFRLCQENGIHYTFHSVQI